MRHRPRTDACFPAWRDQASSPVGIHRPVQPTWALRRCSNQIASVLGYVLKLPRERRSYRGVIEERSGCILLIRKALDPAFAMARSSEHLHRNAYHWFGNRPQPCCSLQLMQRRVHGTAVKRAAEMGSEHTSQMPYVPRAILPRASSIARSNLLSVCCRRTCTAASLAALAWSAGSPWRCPAEGARVSLPLVAANNSSRLASKSCLYRSSSFWSTSISAFSNNFQSRRTPGLQTSKVVLLTPSTGSVAFGSF